MSRKEARKSRSIHCDLNIEVEGTQFSAHWSILRDNSVFFKELYSRKKSSHCGKKTQEGEKKVDLVHLKGIRAELFEKFLRYVYSSARKQRQLVLKEVKDVLKFSLLFRVRHLTSLTRKPCLEDLEVNMAATGFSDVSNLHRALLRFLHDQTTAHSTRTIATFVAREAYKDRSLECLLRVLKIVGGNSAGSNVEMRLKLLDVLITLFSAGLDVSAGPPNCAEAGEDGVRCVSSGRRGNEREVCLGNSRMTRDDSWVTKGKAAVNFPKPQKNRKFDRVKVDSNGEAEFFNAIFPRDNMEDEGKMVAIGDQRVSREGIGRHPEMALKEKLELVGKECQKLTNERVQDSKLDTRNCERQKSHDTSYKCERKSRDTHNERHVAKSRGQEKSQVRANDRKQREAETELKSKSLTEPTENTFIEQETRVIRRKARKRWTREKTVPAMLCVQKEVSTPIATSHGQDLLTTNAIQPEDGGHSNTPCPNVQAFVPRVSPNYHKQPERLFLTGGIQKNNYFASRVVLEYDPINSVYVTISAMTTNRYNHAIARVGHELYVVGGNSGLFEQLRSVESYSVERTEWESGASMHEARDEFSLAACDGCLYAIGGHNGICDLRSVEKLDVGERETASWSFVSSMGSYRAGACAVTVGNRYIYVTGGFNGEVYLNSVELYDATCDRWTEVEPMNIKRAYSSSVLFENNIYILGGFNGAETLSSCEVYNTETKTWRAFPEMNTSRMNATAVVFMGNVVVFGGECESTFLDTVECYDVQNETWDFVQRLPQPMAGLRACVYREDRPPRADRPPRTEKRSQNEEIPQNTEKLSS